MAGVDKVGMSLDDIIKLNKGSRGRGGGRGRGRGGRSGVRGGQAGGQKRGASNNRSRATAGARSGFGMRRTKRGGVTKRGAGRRGGGLFSARRELPADAWQHDMFEGTVVRGGGGARGRGRGGAAASVGNSGSSTILISNLDWGVSDSDIKELFSEFGPLRKATLHYDRSGRSLGTAEVIFGRQDDALRAVKQYNNVLLDGRTMRIQLVGGSSAPAARVASGGQGQSQGRGKPRGGQQRGGRKFGGFRASGMQQRSAFRRGGVAAGRGRGGRGRGRGGRGGKGPALSKDQLDAQLDNYNKKDRMDVE